MTRVLVCGGRDFADRQQMYGILNVWREGIDLLIHGGARGADQMADAWARRHHVPVKSFPANWNRDGMAAGPIRNQQMLDEGKPDSVVAFPGGRGTADMVRRAKAAGVEVIEVPAQPVHGRIAG